MASTHNILELRINDFELSNLLCLFFKQISLCLGWSLYGAFLHIFATIIVAYNYYM